MAAKKRYASQQDSRAWTPDKVRDRLRASALINRLTSHALGECEMSPSMVTAALGLLKKAIPDLASIEHSGEVKATYVAEVPVQASTPEEWSQQHAPRLQ